MKKKMNFAIWLITSMMMLMMTSCDSMNGNEGLTADEQLMQQIDNAEILESVSYDELPSNAQTTLAMDYSESDAEEILKAGNLGYRVNLRRYQGADFGESDNTYFDKNGNELQSKGKGPKGRKGPRGHKPPRDKHEKFDFVYPISVTMSDASVIIGNSEDELKEAIKSWFDANPDVDRRDGRPELVFPVDIILEDSTIVTVNSREELKDAVPHNTDKPRGHRPKVFTFVYPISYTMPDASVIAGDTREALWSEIKAWHEANPDVQERAELNFPVDIQFLDESTETVNSHDELKETVKAWLDANRNK